MRSFVIVLLASGSLQGCPTTTVAVQCGGAPPIPLRDQVIKEMNRDELIAYNTYKDWWQRHCKE